MVYGMLVTQQLWRASGKNSGLGSEQNRVAPPQLPLSFATPQEGEEVCSSLILFLLQENEEATGQIGRHRGALSTIRAHGMLWQGKGDNVMMHIFCGRHMCTAVTPHTGESPARGAPKPLLIPQSRGRVSTFPVVPPRGEGGDIPLFLGYGRGGHSPMPL